MYKFFSFASCDAAMPWQFGFQDPASPIISEIIHLHNNIIFYLILIAFLVCWLAFFAQYSYKYYWKKKATNQDINLFFLGLSFFFSWLLLIYFIVNFKITSVILTNALVFTLVHFHMTIYCNTSYILNLSPLKGKEKPILTVIGNFGLYLCGFCLIYVGRVWMVQFKMVAFAYLLSYVVFITCFFFFYNLTSTKLKIYLKKVFLTFQTRKLLIFYFRKFSGFKGKTDIVLLFLLTITTIIIHPFRYAFLSFLACSVRFHNGSEVLGFYVLIVALTIFVSLPSVRKYLIASYGSNILRLLGWNAPGKAANTVVAAIGLVVPGTVVVVHTEKSLSISIEEKKTDRLYLIHQTKTVPRINAFNSSLAPGQKPIEIPKIYVQNPDYSLAGEVRDAILGGAKASTAISDAVDKVAKHKGWKPRDD